MANYSVIIGIDYYEDAPNLSFCINDAYNWLSLFKNNLDKDHICLAFLTKGKETEAKTILYNLDKLVKQLKPNDIGYFIFSGHGVLKQYKSKKKQVFEEQIRARDRSIMDIEIREIFQNLNKECMFISIIDSCFSGGMSFFLKQKAQFLDNKLLIQIKTFNSFTDVKNDLSIDSNKELDTEFRNFGTPLNRKNTLLFSACKSQELAKGGIIDGKYSSVFTKYAIENIKLHQSKNISEIHNIIKNFLPNEKKNYNQTPQLLGKNKIKNTFKFNTKLF